MVVVVVATGSGLGQDLKDALCVVWALCKLHHPISSEGREVVVVTRSGSERSSGESMKNSIVNNLKNE